MAKYEIGDGLTIRAIVNDVNEHGLVSIAVKSQTVTDYRFWVETSDIVEHTPMTLEQRLAGLSVEQIADALSRKDTALADALEAAGSKIAKARREAGEMRRKVTPKETGPDTRGIMNVGLEHAEAEPKAEQDGLEITSFMLAEQAAKQGRKALDKFMKHIPVLTQKEIDDRMAELLGLADAADHDAEKAKTPF